MTLALVALYDVVRPIPGALTQRQLTEAVNFAIDERPRGPALTSVAYANIIRSVVMVTGYDPGETPTLATPGRRP